MKLLFSIITLIIVTPLFSGNYITKKQAIQDIDFFIDQAQQIHPNLYFKISKSEFKYQSLIITNQIKDSISVNEFSKQMRVLSNHLGDGHTNVNFSNYLRQQYLTKTARLPFKVYIKNNKFYISSSNNKELNKNDEILSINQISNAELLQLIKYTVADIDAFKIKLLEKYFSYYFFIEYGYTNQIEIKFKRDDKIISKSIDLIKTDLTKTSKKYTIQFFDSTAILKINSFGGLDKKDYTQFLEQTFNTIKTKPITNLIIDLTNNGGGNSKFAEMIYPYLNISTVKYHQLYEIKTSKPEKKSIRKRFIKWYMYPLYPLGIFPKMGRILLYKKNGTITSIKTNETHFKPKPNSFNGKVMVLTSNSTYSAAADFVVGFKYSKRGKVIGDTIGQPYSGYIDKIEFNLPNSGISAGVSFKKYEYYGTTSINKLKGVEPDIYFNVEQYSGNQLYKKAISLY